MLMTISSPLLSSERSGLLLCFSARIELLSHCVVSTGSHISREAAVSLPQRRRKSRLPACQLPFAFIGWSDGSYMDTTKSNASIYTLPLVGVVSKLNIYPSSHKKVELPLDTHRNCWCPNIQSLSTLS
jgi:hypothetical protein